MIVLAVQGILNDVIGGPVDAALFANVGDRAEHPETIKYVHDVMIPWGQERGFVVKELRPRHNRDLYDELVNLDNTFSGIPFRVPSGAPVRRSCTSTYKIETVGRYIKTQINSLNTHHTNSRSKLSAKDVADIRLLYEQGWSVRAIAERFEVGKSQIHSICTNKSWKPNATPEAAVVCIGISTDEIQRINNKYSQHWEVPKYPLIDLNLSRKECKKVISNAGLPVPPKSACYFCPFHRKTYWQSLQQDHPDLWENCKTIEHALKIKTGIEASVTDPSFGFNDGKCDEGYCWT